ncbi:NACHT domain-containing protein [Streptomyces griseosporeus]|uniref:NACHT domain-containing protein n=1 Tax=Streptomyces griseosporeus TaxID=1910 RepID=UPI0036A03FC7
MFPFWYWRFDGLEKAGWLAGTLALPASILLLLGGSFLVQRLTVQRRSSNAQVEEGLQALSEAVSDVSKGWMQQVGLQSRRPAAVTWGQPTDPTLRDSTVTTTVTGTSADIEDLADKFLALPRRRLVILGEAGTGKSTLAFRLAAEIMDRRRADNTLPVPIVFPLSAWTPRSRNKRREALRRIPFVGRLWDAERDLERWMSDIIHAQCRLGLAFGTDVALPLLRSEKVMPIFDGLDEIPRPMREAAFSALKDEFDDSFGFILCVRTAEYRDVAKSVGRIERTSGILKRAAVVEAKPLTSTAITAYLCDPNEDDQDWCNQWAPVVREITTNPAHPVTEAFNSALILYLARATYLAGGDPRELLDRTRFPTPVAVRRFLMDGYVPAILGARTTVTRRNLPTQDAAGRKLRERRISSAERWLEWLAYLHSRGASPSYAIKAREIANGAPWIFHRLLFYSPAIFAAVAFVPLIANLMAAGIWATPSLDGGAGGAPPPINPEEVKQIDRIIDPMPPEEVATWPCVIVGILLGEIMVAVVRRRIPGWRVNSTSGSRFASLVAILLCSLTITYQPLWQLVLPHFGFGDPPNPDKVMDTVTMGVFVTVFTMLPAGIAVTTREAFAPRVPRPRLLWRAISVFFICLAAASCYVAWESVVYSELGVTDHGRAVLASAFFVIAMAFVVVPGVGWWSYKISHLYSFILGRLPLQFETFLEDMHRLGILRNVAGTYHFRHAELQDRLAQRGERRWS